MARCYVSEQIAAYCSQEGEAECPECGSSMTYDDDGDLACDECDNVIIIDDYDGNEDFE